MLKHTGAFFKGQGFSFSNDAGKEELIQDTGKYRNSQSRWFEKDSSKEGLKRAREKGRVAETQQEPQTEAQEVSSVGHCQDVGSREKRQRGRESPPGFSALR